jgi:hypothetical protein
MGFGGVVAALLLVLILAAVYAFVIHKDDKPNTAPRRAANPQRHKQRDDAVESLLDRGRAAARHRRHGRPADVHGDRR